METGLTVALVLSVANRYGLLSSSKLDMFQAHISSVVEELSHCYATQICRKNTLLIDDDPQNVNTALENGVNAILYCPADASCVHRSILEMISCSRIM